MSFLADLWTFMRTHKRYVLLPILVVVLVVAVVLFFRPPVVGPFIYTVF